MVVILHSLVLMERGLRGEYLMIIVTDYLTEKIR
jgi:hypothetical protein